MDEIDKARQIITEEIERTGVTPLKVLLFGSRARRDFRQDSDWDFYVIIDKELPYSERREMASCIRSRLAQDGIIVDVFIQAERVVRQRKDNTGYLAYYALKDGVEI